MNIRKSLTGLRISDHSLPIGSGRYKRQNKVPLDLRLVDICTVVDDENHYIMSCSKFAGPHKKLFDIISKIFVNFDSLYEEDIFIMKCESVELTY